MSFKRKAAAAAGKALGLDILPAGSLNAGAEEEFVRQLLPALNIDCVFDVGANVGQYAQELRALGYAGRILSFEPGPPMRAKLEAAAAGDPLWDVLPFALGDAPGTLSLNITALDAMSSFLPPAAAGEVYAPLTTIERTVEVEVRTLADVYDELHARFGFARPFLKLDTQGYDLHVVRGAGERLDRFVGVLSEMAVRPLYVGCPHMIESLELFDARGFDLIGVYKVHPTELLDPHEFNCYLLRRDAPR